MKNNKKLKKTEKEIIAMLLTSQYLDYLNNIKKNVVIEHNGTFLNIREINKIFNSFGKGNNIKGWKNFINKFSKMANEDSEFYTYLEWQESRCQRCNFKPTEHRKLSRYHNEWKIAQEKFDWVVGVYEEKCPECGHSLFYSTGEDKNPEEGLRE